MPYHATIPFPINFSRQTACPSIPSLFRRRKCASIITKRRILSCKPYAIFKKVNIETGDVIFFPNTHYPHIEGVPKSTLKVVETRWTVEEMSDEAVVGNADVVGLEGCEFDWFALDDAVRKHVQKEKKWKLVGRLQDRDGKPFQSVEANRAVEYVVVELAKKCKCKASQKDEKPCVDRVEYDFSR